MSAAPNAYLMHRKCPECGSAKVAEIVYGYPGSDWDWENDVDLGKVVLDWCCIPPEPHRWQCQSCDHEWGDGERSGLDIAVPGFWRLFK